MSFSIRQTCLWIHRYTGLVMVAFLIIAGSTGALLAFYDELDDLFNYQLAYSDVQSNEPLSIAMLHDNVINTYPKYKFSSMPTSLEPDKSAVFSVDKVRDKAAKTQESTQEKAPFQEVYVNPYTGNIIGTRDREQWAWRNTMYKVFWLHRELLLGDIGKLILGIIALIWTINCFIGFYLTLPRKAGASKAKKINDAANNTTNNTINITVNKKRASFVKRWLPAWKIRTKTNTFKLNYDLHQAFGLWLWLMLFIIAWSSVGFNLQQVYQPVMEAVIGLESKQKPSDKPEKPAQITTQEDNKLSVTKADSIAYLTAQADIVAKENGVKIEQLLGIRWISEDNQWQMRFKTNKDIGKKGGASSITVDAITGNIEKVNFGYQSSAASKADQWMATLHMGHISQGAGHLIYQLFLVVIGLAVTVLSGTGAYLWLKGRKQRLKSAQKAINQRAKLSSKLEPYR